MNGFRTFQQIVVIAFVLLLLLVHGCLTSRSVTSVPDINPQKSDEKLKFEKAVDDFITPYVNNNFFSGSLLIARGDNILVSKGYGMANLEHDVPNTPQTKFRIGSVSKQFTAMAILMLQEQGKLNVNDPICNYVSDCPDAWKSITIHHLLTHSSGIPNLTEFLDFKRKMVLESLVEDTLQWFIDKPLNFNPGSYFSYSNSGYIVLGYIIEQVIDGDYEDYLKDNIFLPLHMENTGYDHNIRVRKHRASGYTRVTSDLLYNAVFINMSVPHAAGALYSTIEDLYLWDRALYTERIVKGTSLDLMFTPHMEEYGYGWIVEELYGKKVIGHSGRINGFASFIYRFIDDDVVVIVLSNIEDRPLNALKTGLMKIIFNE